MKSNKTVGCVTNSGEEKIMEAEKQTIAVFTNIFFQLFDAGRWHTIAVGVECRFAIHASRDVFRKTVDGFS